MNELAQAVKAIDAKVRSVTLTDVEGGEFERGAFGTLQKRRKRALRQTPGKTERSGGSGEVEMGSTFQARERVRAGVEAGAVRASREKDASEQRVDVD